MDVHQKCWSDHSYGNHGFSISIYPKEVLEIIPPNAHWTILLDLWLCLESRGLVFETLAVNWHFWHTPWLYCQMVIGPDNPNWHRYGSGFTAQQALQPLGSRHGCGSIPNHSEIWVAMNPTMTTFLADSPFDVTLWLIPKISSANSKAFLAQKGGSFNFHVNFPQISPKSWPPWRQRGGDFAPRWFPARRLGCSRSWCWLRLTSVAGYPLILGVETTIHISSVQFSYWNPWILGIPIIWPIPTLKHKQVLPKAVEAAKKMAKMPQSGAEVSLWVEVCWEWKPWIIFDTLWHLSYTLIMETSVIMDYYFWLLFLIHYDTGYHCIKYNNMRHDFS